MQPGNDNFQQQMVCPVRVRASVLGLSTTVQYSLL